MNDWRRDVLTYWFGLDPKQWWRSEPAIDEEIRERFRGLWEEKRQLPVSSFLDDSLTALAGVILFDQFPRNMFRGDAEQFSTDTLGLGIAKAAIDLGFDDEVQPNERAFFYLPFEHSESLDDQKKSIQLFSRLGDDYMLGFAKKHHDIIERFGRFPHRNAVLGRPPRPAEVEAGDVLPW